MNLFLIQLFFLLIFQARALYAAMDRWDDRGFATPITFELRADLCFTNARRCGRNALFLVGAAVTVFSFWLTRLP